MPIDWKDYAKRRQDFDRLLAAWEDTDRLLEPQRVGGSAHEQDKWKRSPQRIGKPMSHLQLERYVTRSNPALYMEVSRNDASIVGFYLRGADSGRRFICAFPRGQLTEWSVIETDAADLPIREVRGWRTVLVRLLKTRCLTFNQVSEIVRAHYGYSPVEWNALWYEYTRDFR